VVNLRYAARLNFSKPDPSTNNTTEYEALLLGLCKMKALSHPNFTIKSDSKVITDHVEKESEAQGPEMVQYLEVVRVMEKTLPRLHSRAHTKGIEW
jgi:ribonuclease HI